MSEPARFDIELGTADAEGWYLCIPYAHPSHRPEGVTLESPAVLRYRDGGRVWEVDGVMAARAPGFMVKPDHATKRPVDIGISREAYERERLPRFGRRNPERIESEFWSYMIRSKAHPYSVRKYFGDEKSANVGCPLPDVERRAGAMFCFHRLGQSRTTLPDGRVVCVGGEYDDSYDPDFHIYNDVVVLGPGEALEVYGYPAKVFPPTDFHSATLIGDAIWIVGCFGYKEDRQPGVTPVHRLDTRTFRIEPVPATGANPGWVHSHDARLSEDGRAIIVSGGKVQVDKARGTPLHDNFDEFRLSLDTLTWEKLTDRRWAQHRVAFADRKVDLYRIERKDASGRKVYKSLKDFLPFASSEVLEDSETAYNKRAAVVDGVPVLAELDGRGVKLTVQGELPTERVDALLAGIGGLLEEHAGSAAKIERLR